MMDRTLVSMLSLFFFSFFIFSTYVVLNKPLTKYTRASEELRTSAQSSLIFAWPLQVKANSKGTTVTVFARNVNGRALAGKPVTINSSFGTIKESLATTDSEGKSLFYITSSTAGVAEFEAIVDNIKIQRKISVKFE